MVCKALRGGRAGALLLSKSSSEITEGCTGHTHGRELGAGAPQHPPDVVCGTWGDLGSHLPVQSSCAGFSSCSSACPSSPTLTRVLVSLCLSEDVQVTEKITISKQFKEKVIRPILKVGGIGFRARVSGVLSFVHRVVPFKHRAPHQLPPRCEISDTTFIFRHPEARSGPCRNSSISLLPL